MVIIFHKETGTRIVSKVLGVGSPLHIEGRI